VPSSALPSGITSARGLPFQTSRRSHTCHPLSGTAALPADCRHFCPYYAEWRHSQQDLATVNGLARTSSCSAQQYRDSSLRIQEHSSGLFDHLIGAQHYGWGYHKAKRAGGLEIQDHLELGRKLHREITRLLAAQNAINIGGGGTKEVYRVDSVGEQTTLSG